MPTTATITQKQRLIAIDTPLGADVLLLERVSGAEMVSGLFAYELDLLADRQKRKHLSVNPDALLGHGVTIAVAIEGAKRYIHGIVKRFGEVSRDNRFVSYRAEVVPWTWLLTLKSDIRAFQNVDTPEILKTIFKEAQGSFPSLVDFDFKLHSSYRKWDYCVQYRETNFNFVSRLMEQEGMFFFFRHQSGKHTLVVCDSPLLLDECEHQKTAGFSATIKRQDWSDEIFSFTSEHEMRPGKYALRDHHFELTGNALAREVKSRFEVLPDSLEIYDYPGEYAQYYNKPEARLGDVLKHGEEVAKVRIEEEESGYARYHGSSNCRAFYPGARFKLTDHDGSGMNEEYFLLSVTHSMAQTPSYVSNESAGEPYRNSFVCARTNIPYRPPRLTPKPFVQGPQTATVAGESGAETYVDKYGRVKVKFHWDRSPKTSDTSCWVRVSQPWAGGGWGAHFWPRVGQEVVVEFLEGDPDRPLITGSVYNNANMPPYKLPDHVTRSGVMTRSTKNGGASNANEIRMEDAKGKEQLFINAEKDMDLRVEHELREHVGANRHRVVKGESREVVEKNSSCELKAQDIKKVGGDSSLTIGGSHSEKIGSKLSLQVGTERHEKVGTKYVVESGQEITIKGGLKVIVEAGMQLSLKGPGGFVDIGPAGVTIQGIMVKINSGGAAGTGSPAQPDSPGSPTAPDVADDGSKGGKLN